MQDNLLQQYRGIRETISANVDTIGRLLEQANKLRMLAETIQDGTVKLSVEKEAASLQNLIEKLIVQTQELFEKYEEFVRKAFPQ